MTRTVLSLAILGCALFIVLGVWKYLDSRTIDRLEAAASSLRLRISTTNARLKTYSVDSARFETERQQFHALEAALRADLNSARGRTRVVTESRDSAFATIDVDTLSAGLRNLLAIQREVAKSFKAERDLERELREKVLAQLARTVVRLRKAEVLLSTVIAQRDSAVSIIAGHEKRLEFNFFRNLFQDIPRKLACAAGGSIVAEINEGDVLLGAVIGLATCLIVGGIL